MPSTRFGSGSVLGAVGVGINDWRAVHWSALTNIVLPVMPIASDYFFNVDSVAWGLANFRSVLVTIRNWYALESFWDQKVPDSKPGAPTL